MPPDAPYSRYGSDVHKQVYVYGALDPRPIELRRRFGFAWGVGGWLLTPFLARTSAEDLARLRTGWPASSPRRSPATTPTRSRWPRPWTSTTLRRYARQATGEKFLLTPTR